MRRWLSYLVAKLGAPVDVVRNGCKFRLYLNNNLIDFGLLLKKDYNGEDIDFLTEHLSDGSVAVDLGANIGLYAMQLANTGPRVAAIDPNPLMANHLRFHAEANEFDACHVFECAIADAPARADLTIRRDDLSIVAVEENPDGDITMRTLADVLDELGVTRVDALKVDIEGYEDRALAPYLMSCPDHMLPKRIVIEEQSDLDHPACHVAFRERGYALRGRSRNNRFFELTAAPTTAPA